MYVNMLRRLLEKNKKAVFLSMFLSYKLYTLYNLIEVGVYAYCIKYV